jgi:hypothetical protein
VAAAPEFPTELAIGTVVMLVTSGRLAGRRRAIAPWETPADSAGDVRDARFRTRQIWQKIKVWHR